MLNFVWFPKVLNNPIRRSAGVTRERQPLAGARTACIRARYVLQEEQQIIKPTR